MVTKLHLSQIRSSDPLKYKNLLEEIISTREDINNINNIGVKGVLNSFKELQELENKEIGFYLVTHDENYNNNPTHYYYEGLDFKMVGGEASNKLNKKTIVFYMKKYNNVGQSMQLYFNDKGYINNIIAHIPNNDKQVTFKLWNENALIGEFDTNSDFTQWDAYYNISSSPIKLEITSNNINIDNININVDVIIN